MEEQSPPPHPGFLSILGWVWFSNLFVSLCMFGFHEPIPNGTSSFISPTCNHSVNLAHGKDPLQSGLHMCNVYVLMNILGQSREEWNGMEVVVRACCCLSVSFVVLKFNWWMKRVCFLRRSSSLPSSAPMQPSVIDCSGSSLRSAQPCCDAAARGWHQRCTLKTWSPSCRTCDASAE